MVFHEKASGSAPDPTVAQTLVLGTHLLLWQGSPISSLGRVNGYAFEDQDSTK